MRPRPFTQVRLSSTCSKLRPRSRLHVYDFVMARGTGIRHSWRCRVMCEHTRRARESVNPECTVFKSCPDARPVRPPVRREAAPPPHLGRGERSEGRREGPGRRAPLGFSTRPRAPSALGGLAPIPLGAPTVSVATSHIGCDGRVRGVCPFAVRLCEGVGSPGVISECLSRRVGRGSECSVVASIKRGG